MLLRTYNFFVSNGNVTINVDVNAIDEDEALSLIDEAYPSEEGWNYTLF